jgi:deoxyuridine 5'-triphosphate nucleotidohydrolase
MRMLVKLLEPNAKVPFKASKMAAGYDLYAIEASTVPARQQAVIRTGISIALPEGTYGQIASRSRIARDHNVHVGAGVIDADYRGEIQVLLRNLGNIDFTIHVGDRIAQLLVLPVCCPLITTITTGEELPATIRGTNGFGSTGTN